MITDIIKSIIKDDVDNKFKSDKVKNSSETKREKDRICRDHYNRIYRLDKIK